MYIKPNLLSVKCTLYCTVHRNETKSEKEWFKNTIWNGFQIVSTVQYFNCFSSARQKETWNTTV